jgi:siroheme synthase
MSGLRMLEVLKRERTSGMDQTIKMSIREMEQLKMIVRIKGGKITVVEAAESSIRIMIQRCRYN